MRYGFEPWLVETLVGPTRDSASLRAVNRWRLGETAGRGRQDSRHDVAAGHKVIKPLVLVLNLHGRHRTAGKVLCSEPVLACG